MGKRRRLGLIALVACAWVAFTVLVLVNSWHGYYVAVSFGLAVAAHLIMLGPRPPAEHREPADPWSDRALIPERLRRRRDQSGRGSR